MVFDPLLRHEVKVRLLQTEHRLWFEVAVMAGRSMVVVWIVVLVMREVAVVVVVTEIGSIRSTTVTA